MKKILLATTMLVATAGFAAADVSFSGSAAAGIARNGTANGGAADPNTSGLADDTFFMYSNATLNVTMSAASDNGLEFGATTGISAGRSYAMADDDGFDIGGATMDDPEIYVSGSFGKVSFNADGYDFFDDANTDGDVKYTGTFGAISVGLIADVDASEYSASADATFSGITVHADADTYNIWNVSAAYTMGAFTAKVGSNEASDHYIRGEYANNGIGAYAQYNALADGNQWEVGGSYANNGISVAASTDEASSWKATAGYDLGGGLSLEAGVNYTSDAFIGAKMSF